MNINFRILFLLCAISIVLISCEDPAPNDYQPRIFVEAYLFVDEPISGIKVLQTQPLDRAYSEDIAHIKDAQVKIIQGNDTFKLEYSDEKPKGYYYPDTTYKVKAEMQYILEIITKNGEKIKSITRTPGRTHWIKKSPYKLYYPKDTLKLPKDDTLDIEWAPVNKVNFYFVRVACLDTLEYGIYLEPPTDEKNRRCFNVFNDQEQMYKNVTMWGFVGNTKSPAVWMSFKWFGKHSLDIVVPDNNMLNWFMNLYFSGSSYHEPNFNSVNGAEGVFGSAFILKSEVFLHKNQP